MFEKDYSSCAVGGVFSAGKGEENVKLVLELLEKLPHRGGQIFAHNEGQVVKVGDGAGVSCSLDQEYYNSLIGREVNDAKTFAVGNFFLPIDDEARDNSKKIIADICKKYGLRIIPNKDGAQWRPIPFNSPDDAAAKKLKLQEFEQVFLEQDPEFSYDHTLSAKELEVALLAAHKEIEVYAHNLNLMVDAANKEAAISAAGGPSAKPLPKLAVASLSCKKVIYKGMLLPEEVKYFEDLQHLKSDEVTYHIRQSTNVSPSPGNAQPFGIIAHNGELNSVDGNALKLQKAARGFSDSRTFDENLRELIASGKDVIEAVTMLMPPPQTGISSQVDDMLDDLRISDLEYNGPAHMVFSYDGIHGAKLDSSALRPSRYLIAKDAAGAMSLIIGSEDMFLDEKLQDMNLEVVKRGMLKAGEMIVIENGVIKENAQVLSELAARHKKLDVEVEKVEARDGVRAPMLHLGRRELEVRKYQMLPLCQGASKKIAMGDDTNPLKTDERDLPTLSDHFKEKFSQVSSPSIDPDKEISSFSLTTYLGSKDFSGGRTGPSSSPDDVVVDLYDDYDDEKEVDSLKRSRSFDGDSTPVLKRTKSQFGSFATSVDGSRKTRLYKIDSPILKSGEFAALISTSAAEGALSQVDFTIHADEFEGRKFADVCKEKIRNICYYVEGQVRAGKTVIALDGSAVSEDIIALPDVLVTAAVYSHLHKCGLNKQASIVVNSAQMESPHHFSVLSALGAAAVNPAAGYDFARELAQEQGEPAKYQEYCDNFHHAVEKSHLETMARYGITSAQVYCGSRLVETVSLDLAPTIDAESYDPCAMSEIFKGVKTCEGFSGVHDLDKVLDVAAQDHDRRFGSRNFSSGHYAYSSTGVSHSYNPVVVAAVRDITNEYRTQRKLKEHCLEKAAALDQMANHGNITKADVDSAILETKELTVSLERQSQQSRNQKDRLLNSLFFVDGIVDELKSIPATSGASALEPRFSINEVKLRSFISVVETDEAAADSTVSMTKAFIDFRNGALPEGDFKKLLLAKAGYDASQIELIEDWVAAVKNNESVEIIAEKFALLNEKNQGRITAVFSEVEAIDAVLSENSDHFEKLQAQKEINDFLSAQLANSEAEILMSDELRAKAEALREEAKTHDLLPRIADDGAFETDDIDARPIDYAFARGMEQIVADKAAHRVTIADHIDLRASDSEALPDEEVQKASEIAANHFVTGGMSHGALTKSAHKDVAKSAKLIRGIACTGEGGKTTPDARMVQIASGRFGINPEYFEGVDIVEIKIVQGAKPGQGGMLPAEKVSVEIAGIRGGIPFSALISPPPHHDIYSIEDLQQLIHDVKELKSGVQVAVKLCASEGIDQIAIGVAKSGADIINIASGSGGTGAASIDSIKSAGLPSEVGLVMVNQALIKAGIRDLVKLQVSGFPNTPEGVIKMAILGGDILESGTTDLMLLGCDMHRKCNVPGACGPGITNNEAGYQGSAEDLALYKINLAKAVHEELKKLGVTSLQDLRGRVDLLNPENLRGKVSDEFIAKFMTAPSSIEYPQLDYDTLEVYRRNANDHTNAVQDQMVITAVAAGFEDFHAKLEIEVGALDVTNRTFGAALVGKFHRKLSEKAPDQLTVKSSGVVGQSYGAFNCHGLSLEHTGSAQDGFGKSMSGGILVVKKPESEIALTDSTYVGNAALYGASGGKAFIPSAGSRCGVLMKGATLVVNGDVGDYACEYMTSGSFVALGKVGKHFGSGMCGGVVMIYSKEDLKIEKDARLIEEKDGSKDAYFAALKALLQESYDRTKSLEAKAILDNFEVEKHNFKIVLPRSLDKIKTLDDLAKVEESFTKRHGYDKHPDLTISPFEQVWLQEKRAVLEREAAEKAALVTYDLSAIKVQEQAAKLYQNQQAQMRIYGSSAARVAGGLGKSDQVLSDDVGELMDELFSHGKKCSCDSVTCTSSEVRREDPKAKHPDTGCPLGKNPNLINGILNDPSLPPLERAKRAFKMQVETSPFAGFTGSACPAPCQDSCTHSAGDEGNDEAVKIKRIELLLHRIALKNGWYDELGIFAPNPEAARVGQKVMIVGSGPSSLEAAYHLAKQGVQVDVFEKSDQIGGLLRYGIPDHKLQKETIDFYKDKLQEMGVKFHTKQAIDMARIKETHPSYDLYLDARGVASSPQLLDERFSETKGNHSLAMDFLEYCNKFNQAKKEGFAIEHPFELFRLGRSVAVIGSGDTAEDVKRTILKLNEDRDKSDKVKLITFDRQPKASLERSKIGSSYPHYRETASIDLAREFADADEDMASHEAAVGSIGYKVDESSGTITGVRHDLSYIANQRFSRSNRGKPVQIRGSSTVVPCDSAITAIGFKAADCHPDSSGLHEISRGSIVLIGDVLSKSSAGTSKELIVSAEESGRKAAMAFLEATKQPNPQTVIRGNVRRGNVTIQYADQDPSVLQLATGKSAAATVGGSLSW